MPNVQASLSSWCFVKTFHPSLGKNNLALFIDQRWSFVLHHNGKMYYIKLVLCCWANWVGH